MPQRRVLPFRRCLALLPGGTLLVLALAALAGCAAPSGGAVPTHAAGVPAAPATQPPSSPTALPPTQAPAAAATAPPLTPIQAAVPLDPASWPAPEPGTIHVDAAQSFGL